MCLKGFPSHFNRKQTCREGTVTVGLETRACPQPSGPRWVALGSRAPVSPRCWVSETQQRPGEAVRAAIPGSGKEPLALVPS